MSDLTETMEDNRETTEPEDEFDESCIGEPMDERYLERLSEEAS